jgi:carbon starvation protein
MAVAAGVGGEREVWYGLHQVSVDAGGALPPVTEALSGFVVGASSFLTVLGVPAAIGAVVVAVLVISFAATSLDTSLRIQRLVLAELGRTYGVRPLENRWIGGAISCGSVLVLVYSDFDAGAKSLWPVFGATNQVLAALTLLLCALYLRTLGRRTWPYLVPAVFVMVVTFSAMAIQVLGDLRAGKWAVSCVGALIAVLTLWVALEGGLAWRRPVAERSPG